MIKDCNVDCPLPTAMASPLPTQAGTRSYMCPFLSASTVQSLSLEMQEARAAGLLSAPKQGLQPSRGHQGREPFLALQRVVRGGRQRGARNCPDVAFSSAAGLLHLPNPTFSIWIQQSLQCRGQQRRATAEIPVLH